MKALLWECFYIVDSPSRKRSFRAGFEEMEFIARALVKYDTTSVPFLYGKKLMPLEQRKISLFIRGIFHI